MPAGQNEDADVFDVDHPGLAIVEGVQNIQDPNRLRSAPGHDLAPELEVEALEQVAGEPDLLKLQLVLVFVQNLITVIIAVIQCVREVVESPPGDSGLPVARQVEIELEGELLPQHHHVIVVRVARFS